MLGVLVFTGACPVSSPTFTYRAKVAGLSRDRASDDPELVDARRDLRAAKLEAHVQKVLADAPPLTPEQRDRIATLLQVGVS